MRFLVDEDVPVEVTRRLQLAGHGVQVVTEALGAQSSDAEIWAYAVRIECIVVTCNRQDFLELAGTKPETGLVILKRRQTRQAECRHLLQLVERAGLAGLMGNINFA